jgi:8-oxo-dGTP pyrophosphatase MutT (NUDIX family)
MSKVGQFMIGVGAILEHLESGRILVVRRDGTDFNKGHWEMCYGRIDQHEDVEVALKRELNEELGITKVEIKKLVRVSHFYRGEIAADKEIFVFTFHCQIESDQVTLSPEHSEHQWVTPQEALQLIELPGVKQDIEIFLENKPGVVFSNTERKLTGPY